ncbi:alpha/beta hydrolase [Granulicoccus phenolivorans]|uniref:alpha/beta hydrolase n=1 Tax=Granulicoccus phenolivorans TaxID=266854 RepID=UPI0003F5DE66|nr:alpha/beta hydrolase [Granulicoccus phenolivorans]
MTVAWATAVAWADYWSSLPWLRGVHGMLNDGITYWNAALNRRRPAFAHPNEIIAQWDQGQLRHFTPGSTGVPTLVVAPQSGLTGAALDTTMRTGLIATLLNNGHTNVYALEWVDPRGNARASGIDEHLAIIRESVDLAGGRANLIGYSQSGWAVTIIAALHPEKAVSLTLGAAPIDTHRSVDAPSVMGRVALSEFTEVADGVLPQVPWTWPGGFQVLGFNTTEMLSEYGHRARLWARINEPTTVAEERAILDWLATPQDLPGPFTQWTLEHMFANNELIRNVLEIGDEVVDLGRIDCPLFLLTGADDLLVPEDQLLALAPKVSTPSNEVHHVSVPASHLDLLVSSDALENYWAPMLRRSATLS